MHFAMLLCFNALALAPSVLGAYTLTDNYAGPSFLTGFTHQAIPDPTGGRVNYVDQATALAKNLTFTSADTLVLRADSTTVLNPSGAGRDSVRIRSVKTYTTHVAVFDIRHMPQGCGTWPAAWEVDENVWPAHGEVDVVEGANDISPNQVTLHMSPGCTQPTNRVMQGKALQTDCDTNVNGNTGCGVALHSTASYGPEFNKNGGGYFVLERTPTDVRVWFFARNDGSAPAAVASGAQTIDPSTFPKPGAVFSSQTCDFNTHLGNHNIIINLTLCGAWAGALFNQNGCAGSCVDVVNSQPSAFANAFWDIKGIRVYE